MTSATAFSAKKKAVLAPVLPLPIIPIVPMYRSYNSGNIEDYNQIFPSFSTAEDETRKFAAAASHFHLGIHPGPAYISGSYKFGEKHVIIAR
jgi:hypothetical protein